MRTFPVSSSTVVRETSRSISPARSSVNGSVNIETGVSNTTLVIPSGIPVQLTVDGGLSNVTYDSAWSKSGNMYTQAGTGPQLTIVVHIGAGNLTLTR